MIKLGAAAALIATLILVASWWQRRTLPETAMYAELIRDHALCDRHLQSVQSAVSRLTRGTRYEGKVLVNAPPVQPKDHLYLYLVCDIDRIQSRYDFVGNCAYAGTAPVIRCDTSFFERFSERHGIWDATPPIGTTVEAFRERLTAAVIFWVLGHELGHIMSGHSRSQFQHPSLDAVFTPPNASQKFEFEADAWLARKLSELPEDEVEVASIMFSLIVSQLYRYVPKDRIHPGVGLPIISGPIEIPEGTSHPEFILRAVRLLSTTLANSNVSGSSNILEHAVMPIARSIAVKPGQQR